MKQPQKPGTQKTVDAVKWRLIYRSDPGLELSAGVVQVYSTTGATSADLHQLIAPRHPNPNRPVSLSSANSITRRSTEMGGIAVMHGDHAWAINV